MLAFLVDFESPERLGEYLRARGRDAGRLPVASPRTLLSLCGLDEAQAAAILQGARDVGLVPFAAPDGAGSGAGALLLAGERPAFGGLAVALRARATPLSSAIARLLEADERRRWSWSIRGAALEPGARCLVMGVINVTDDSFSDGGRHREPEEAIRHGLRLAQEGADLLDVGGESTRPGAQRVSEEDERRRVVAVVEGLAGATDVPISVDTTRASVAAAAIEAGASVVNDVSGLRFDPEMAGVVAETGAGLIVMHMKGTPREMQDDPSYDDLLAEVIGDLGRSIETARAAGVPPERIAVDPGIGFGKRLEHNLALLEHLGSLRALGRPILVGVSRKSFLGELTGRSAQEREAASLAAAAAAVGRGATVVRVHEVAPAVDAIRTLDGIRGRAR